MFLEIKLPIPEISDPSPATWAVSEKARKNMEAVKSGIREFTEQAARYLESDLSQMAPELAFNESVPEQVAGDSSGNGGASSVAVNG